MSIHINFLYSVHIDKKYKIITRTCLSGCTRISSVREWLGILALPVWLELSSRFWLCSGLWDTAEDVLSSALCSPSGESVQENSGPLSQCRRFLLVEMYKICEFHLLSLQFSLKNWSPTFSVDCGPDRINYYFVCRTTAIPRAITNMPEFVSPWAFIAAFRNISQHTL